MATDVRRLQQAFGEAELGADTDALGALLSDDFRSIGEQGYVLNTAQWIGKFAEFAYISLESSDVEVRPYGQAAVVGAYNAAARRGGGRTWR